MQKITKAVFPVAGMGTRFLPATKASPKEMLCIVDKPLIQYAVEEALSAGITELIFITGRNKRAIEDHFDKAYELERELEDKGKEKLLNIVQSVLPKGASCVYVRQQETLGLGHAILCARPVVRNHPFAVLLPDVIVDQYQSNLKKDNLAAMIKRYSETGHSQIMVEPVPQHLVNQYGVVDISGAQLQQGENAVIADMVEKPDLEEAPSNFAITGRYILSPTIWDLLAFTPPGAGDEIQLTDALHQLRLLEVIEAYHIKGKSHDCGNKLGYALANAEYALRSAFGAEFKQKLAQLLAD